MWTALIVGWHGIASAAPAGCDVLVSPDAWSRTLDRVESAFVALDQAAFLAEMGVASRALRCLDAPVTPQLAARYHRLVGLSEFVARDEERARLAFAAARAADPLGALPTTVLPQGHTARALSESASTPGRTRPLAVRRREQLYVDGVLATARPVDRDALVQVQVGSEMVLNADLKPGDRLPYGVRSQAARRAWVAVAAGLGVAGAAAATLWLVPS